MSAQASRRMLNFLWGGWFAVGAVKLGGDDDASKLGVHVGDGGLGLGAVPGGVGAGVIQVMGLVARTGRCVARLREAGCGVADAGDLLGVLDRDLDGPAGRVPFDDLACGGGQVGADQRHVVAGTAWSRTSTTCTCWRPKTPYHGQAMTAV